MSLQWLALEAARAGARAIVTSGHRLVIAYKDGRSQDPVTSADEASERAIRALLAEHRGADAVQAEEFGSTPGTSGVRWIIDPLDGTVNFSHGLDRYAVSVAAQDESQQRVVAAAILQPATGGWLALQAGGVTGSPQRIGVATAAVPARALVAFAVPNEPALRADAYRILAGLAPRVQDLRNFGSSVCDLATVATGELDAFISFNPAPWDVAAGVAIIEAAGGSNRRWRRGDGLDVIAAGATTVVDALYEWLGG